ncbi:MAG: choice-of-anchor tandem repeat GloVer-containing protein [Candidatus Sulfotelmatobacter sp.]
MLVLSFITTQSAQAQTVTILHSFNISDGMDPYAGLVQATNGNLYGTTIEGGANFFGTVFKITTGGTLTTVHNFAGYPSDGETSYAVLLQDSNGNLYGTTTSGGSVGAGTVFRMTLGGTVTILHNFGSTDGETPYAGLIQASNGNLYGTTYNGGVYNGGTVFKITPTGTLTTLDSFTGSGTEGDFPYGGLVQATNGNLYGTTYNGGTNGQGTVFEVTPSGTLTTLHDFDLTDGASPYAQLVQATNGNFYGTTGLGGASGAGTVFKVTPSGTLTSLYSFSGSADGGDPISGLIQATDGNLYGTTNSGGASGKGTIFKITPSGTLTTVHSFAGYPSDGDTPQGGLIQDTNGKLYGTTVSGGANGFGTVFSLSVGLGPFVETLPTSGKVGAAVKILGTSLTGATSVTFNGTAATFTVVSSSEITTTVPTGATTGKVQVVRPGGTLSSNVSFRVVP